MKRLALLVLIVACGPKNPSSTAPAPAPSPPTFDPVKPQPPAPPAPTDPATVTEGAVTDGYANGLHILVKRIPGAETTSTQLFVQGGVRNWTKANAGIEQLAISTATTGGTQKLDKDAFAKKLADLGSSIGGYSQNDFSAFTAWSLLPRWDETFGMLVDTFRTPALPQQQIEVVRAQMIAGLKVEQDQPDGKLRFIVHQNVYRGHAYENRSVGTLESVPGLTRDALAAHLGKLRETSRLLLVVVGDVDPKRVFDAVTTRLGDMPRGAYKPSALPAVSFDKATVTFVEQKLPTVYFQSVFPGPGWRDPDYPVAVVAMNTLHHRVWEEVRTKRNLSYAPNAFFAGDSEVTLGGLYVTAVDPKTTLDVMLAEAKKLRDTAIPDKELVGTKSTLLTYILAGREAPAEQGQALAMNQILAGDWRADTKFPERVRAVTSAQVQAWAAKNVMRMRSFLIGEKSRPFEPSVLEKF